LKNQATIGALGPWKFGAFGKVYHRAAKQTLGGLRRKGASVGIEVCPAIFLSRHAVELYLKGIVNVGRSIFLMSGGPEPPLKGNLYKTHRLDDLFETVTTILKSVGVGTRSQIAGLGSYADARELIRELDKVDERSFTFRYPVNTKGEVSLLRGTKINMDRFGNLFDSLLSFLAQCDEFLESHWNAMVAAHTKAESEGRHGEWPDVKLSRLRPR
jgi:hypothetical protein